MGNWFGINVLFLTYYKLLTKLFTLLKIQDLPLWNSVWTLSFSILIFLKYFALSFLSTLLPFAPMNIICVQRSKTKEGFEQLQEVNRNRNLTLKCCLAWKEMSIPHIITERKSTSIPRRNCPDNWWTSWRKFLNWNRNSNA